MKHLVLLGLVLILPVGCVVEAPISFLYESCNGLSDCEPAADACFDIVVDQSYNRMCSTFCDSDADCLDGGVCYALYGDPDQTFICYARCTDIDGFASDAYCYFGFVCSEVESTDGFLDYICLPD